MGKVYIVGAGPEMLTSLRLKDYVALNVQMSFYMTDSLIKSY